MAMRNRKKRKLNTLGNLPTAEGGQCGLFGFQPPTSKVPISAERIRQARDLLNKGDPMSSAAAMREVREGLEAYEQTITNSKTKST
jgi:hypothetical protein